MNDLLRDIQRLVGSGWYRFTTHALDGMATHFVSADEVVYVVLAAKTCVVQSNGRCRIEGSTDLETKIVVVIEIDGEAVIVTAYERMAP